MTLGPCTDCSRTIEPCTDCGREFCDEHLVACGPCNNGNRFCEDCFPEHDQEHSERPDVEPEDIDQDLPYCDRCEGYVCICDEEEDDDL